ncbi:Uncharacterised protein [Vibrio cholerae]|nr:Uncharacterised protein [Vibrio cholerae]
MREPSNGLVTVCLACGSPKIHCPLIKALW